MRPRLSDRYIFGELILPFFIGTLAVLMMLVGNTLFYNLNEMMQQRWPVKLIAQFLLFNIPTVLVMTLPVSTALAASLATTRMVRDNEFTVLRSSGVPLLRTFVPILLFGAITSALGLYLSDKVVPWAWREQQNVQLYLDNLPSNPIDAGFTVPVQDGNIHYVITFGSAQKISDTRRRLNKVVIVESEGIGKTDDYPIIITAESADYENSVWYLKNVVTHHYDKEGMTALDVVTATGTMKLRIDFSQSGYSMPSGQEDKMSFQELSDLATISRRQGQTRAAVTYDVGRWFKLSLPLMALVFSLCGPPLAMRFARTGAFTGVLLSIIIVFIAWNTLLFLKAVALGSFLPAPVAAWATNILFTALGLWLLKTQE